MHAYKLSDSTRSSSLVFILGLVSLSLVAGFYLDGALVNPLSSGLDKLEYRITALINNLFGGGSLHDGSLNARSAYLSDALNYGLQSPIFGNGLWSFPEQYGSYAHNNFAELFADLGLIGVFLYYLIYIELYRYAKHSGDYYTKYITYITLGVHLFFLTLGLSILPVSLVYWCSYFSSMCHIVKKILDGKCVWAAPRAGRCVLNLERF